MRNIRRAYASSADFSPRDSSCVVAGARRTVVYVARPRQHVQTAAPSPETYLVPTRATLRALAQMYAR